VRDHISLACDLRLIGRGVVSESFVADAEVYAKEAYENYANCVHGNSDDTGVEEEQGWEGGMRLSPEKKTSYPSFDEVWPTWKKFSRSGIKWLEQFPELKECVDVNGDKVTCEEDLDCIDHLLTLNIIPFYYKVAEKAPRLKLMVGLALCYIGGNLASSFCERVNSAAKLIMTHDRTQLGEKHLQMLCVLRMNRTFMEYMRTYHKDLLTQWALNNAPDHESWTATASVPASM